MKKVAVLQSNYIPWRGYFDIIKDVDLFVFYDEVKYTKNDWRNRNKIYTRDGLKWITLPCGSDYKRKISEVKFNPNVSWQTEHHRLICEAYKKAPYIDKYKPFLDYIFLERSWEYLSELNQYIIKHISHEMLGINAEFADSTDYQTDGQKNEKLLSLVLATGASHYLSGPAAKAYLDEEAFANRGITVQWKDYSGYPEYKQTREPFEGNVSIIDLLVNVGNDAPYYVWGWRG